MSLDRSLGSESQGIPPLAPGTGPDSVDAATQTISKQVVRVYLDAFGRGPTHARTYVQPKFAVCVLRGVFTTAEHSMIAGGGGSEVEGARDKVNKAHEDRFISIIETQTGRPVLSHLARVATANDVAVHFFLFDHVPVARDADAG